MNPVFKIGSIQTITGKDPASFDTAINNALAAGQLPSGVPYVFGTNICQSFITRVLDTSMADLAAQAVQDALDAGTVIPPIDKAAMDAQAVAEAIAAGDVIAVAKK